MALLLPPYGGVPVDVPESSVPGYKARGWRPAEDKPKRRPRKPRSQAKSEDENTDD